MEQLKRPEILAELQFTKDLYATLKQFYETLSPDCYNEAFLATVWMLAGFVSENAKVHSQTIEIELDETVDCLAERVFAVQELNLEKLNERTT